MYYAIPDGAAPTLQFVGFTIQAKPVQGRRFRTTTVPHEALIPVAGILYPNASARLALVPSPVGPRIQERNTN